MRSFDEFWPYYVRSLRGDLRMYGLMWTGRMGAEAHRLSRVAA